MFERVAVLVECGNDDFPVVVERCDAGVALLDRDASLVSFADDSGLSDMEFIAHLLYGSGCILNASRGLFLFHHAGVHEPCGMGFSNTLAKILSLLVHYSVVEDLAPEFGADFASDGMRFPFRHGGVPATFRDGMKNQSSFFRPVSSVAQAKESSW